MKRAGMELAKDYWISIASLKDAGFELHTSNKLPIKNLLPQINYLSIFASNSINDVTGPIACYDLPAYQCLMFPFEIKDFSVKDPRIVKGSNLVPAFVMILFRNIKDHQQKFAEMRSVLLMKITEWRKNFSSVNDITISEVNKLSNIVKELESTKTIKDLDISVKNYNKQFFVDQLRTFSSMIDKKYFLLFITNSNKYFDEIATLLLSFGYPLFPTVEKKNNLIVAQTRNNLVVRLSTGSNLKKIKNKSVMFFLDTSKEFESFINNVDKLELEERENCLIYLHSDKGEQNLVKKHFNILYNIKTGNVSFVEEIDDSSWLEQLIQFIYRVVFKFKNYDQKLFFK